MKSSHLFNVVVFSFCLSCSCAAKERRAAKVAPPPRDQPTPEAFGARGDGRTDDFDAIAECLRKFNRCEFRARTYVVRERLPVTHGTVIQGAGIDRTTIRLADNCAAALAFPILFAVIGNAPYTAANGVQVAGLTVDCNFAGQRVPGKEHVATLAGVALWGSSNRLERVKAIHFQVGTCGAECFALFCVLAPGQANVPGSEIRSCEVTEVGSNEGLSYPSSPIVTCISSGGTSHTQLAAGTRIEDCRIHDMTTHPQRQKSALHGLTFGATRRGVIRGNQVENFYGNAIYQDSWTTLDSEIVNNRLLNVRYGIYLSAPAGDHGAIYEGVTIANNEIRLAGASLKYDTAKPYANLQRGIYFYGQPRFRRLTVRDNRIVGRNWRVAGAELSPEPLQWLLNPADQSGFYVTNNVIDVPRPALK